MSIERGDAHEPVTPGTPDANGDPPGRAAADREAALTRARCSNLRHWCRALLDDPNAAGVLDAATVTDLRATPPEVTESEGQKAVEVLARGGSLPPNHPLAAPGVPPAALKAEHERLRTAFFALYDHLHPGDDLTDEYFLAQQGEPMLSMSDVLAQIEREFGEPN